MTFEYDRNPLGWYKLTPSDSIKKGCRSAFTIKIKDPNMAHDNHSHHVLELAVYHHDDDRYYAMNDVCPHQGYSLSDGDIEGDHQ